MGHLLKIKCVDSRVNVHIFASAGVTFTLTTVQVPILAVTHTKWITVRGDNCYIKLPAVLGEVYSEALYNNRKTIEYNTV